MPSTLNNDTCYLPSSRTIEQSAKYQESWWYKNGHSICFPICFVFVAISLVLSFGLLHVDSPLIFASLATPFFTTIILLISIVLFACKKPKYGSAVFLFFWTPIFLAYLSGGIFNILYFCGIYSDDTLKRMDPTSSGIVGACFIICLVIYCITTWTMLMFYKRHADQFSFWSCHNPCMLGLIVTVLSGFIILILIVMLQGEGDCNGCDSSCCDGGSGGGESDDKRKRREENVGV